MTTAEQHMVMRLAQQEPGAMLALLARCLEPIATHRQQADRLERKLLQG